MLKQEEYAKKFGDLTCGSFDALYHETMHTNSTLYMSQVFLDNQIKWDFKRYHKSRETIASFKKRYYDGVIYVDEKKHFIGALIKKAEE